MSATTMEWAKHPLGGVKAYDADHNCWAVKPARDGGGFLVYVNGYYKGRYAIEDVAKQKAESLAAAVVAAPLMQKHAMLSARA